MGTSVLVQKQAGPKKGKWVVSGTVREVLEGNSYTVKLDESN